MGLDSGDDHVLKLLKGDRHSLDSNKRAVELYSENDIEIYTSFVLFGLGHYKSTEKSMEATLRFAEWLAAETSTVSFDSALMYPDRLAPIGKLIWNPEEASSVMADNHVYVRCQPFKRPWASPHVSSAKVTYHLTRLMSAMEAKTNIRNVRC